MNTQKGMVKNAMPFNVSEHFFDMSLILNVSIESNFYKTGPCH